MKQVFRYVIISFMLLPTFLLAAEYTSEKDVKAVQRALVYLDYSVGTIDGVMGKKTIDAIRLFQREQGMEETGKITVSLLKRLPWPTRYFGNLDGRGNWVEIDLPQMLDCDCKIYANSRWNCVTVEKKDSVTNVPVYCNGKMSNMSVQYDKTKNLYDFLKIGQ